MEEAQAALEARVQRVRAAARDERRWLRAALVHGGAVLHDFDVHVAQLVDDEAAQRGAGRAEVKQKNR